jgi:hypothetical protein
VSLNVLLLSTISYTQLTVVFVHTVILYVTYYISLLTPIKNVKILLVTTEFIVKLGYMYLLALDLVYHNRVLLNFKLADIFSC